VFFFFSNLFFTIKKAQDNTNNQRLEQMQDGYRKPINRTRQGIHQTITC